MIQGLDDLLLGDGEPGLPEIRQLLRDLLGGAQASGRLSENEPLKGNVYRLRFEVNGGLRSLVVKRLAPEIAKRNWLVATRWLPRAGLSSMGPSLLGTAAEPRGRSVWQVYEDLGQWSLDRAQGDAECVKAAIRAIAELHLRLAGHPLLGECRLWGGDLGVHFYTSNLHDAIRALESLRPAVELTSERQALRDRLLGRLHTLLDEQRSRSRAMNVLGGPETLLHGDLWTKNVFVIPAEKTFEVRLIDWDHAAVGLLSYDLSTFLLRFPRGERKWILDAYQEAVSPSGWRLPAPGDLNLLFDTAERARIANRVIWPAVAVLDGEAWGFDALAEVDQWFETLEPVLP